MRLMAMVCVSAWCVWGAVPPEFVMRETVSAAGVRMKHVVYVPSSVEAGKKYPLVVYLHGYCPQCTTHERILQESGLQVWHGYGRNEQREPTFLVAPVGGGERWSTPARREAVFGIVDGLMKEFPVDARRVYILGFSMGAEGTWNYLQQRPGFFAAANPQAIGPMNVDVELVKNTPIWATIGVDDDARRLDLLRAAVAKIRAANGDPDGAATWVTGVNPRFTVFPNTGHGEAQGATQRLPGFLDWFYAQVNDGNAAPHVRFVRPLPGEGAYAGTVKAVAAVVDAEGKVDRVVFSLDGAEVGVDREAPYEFAYEGMAAGEHKLRAVAYDAGGKWRAAEIAIRVK